MNAVFWISIVSTVFPLNAGGESAELPKAEEVLRRAEAALKGARVVRYAFLREPLSEDEKGPKAAGTVLLSGYRNMFPEKFRLDATVRKPDVDEPEKLLAGADGDLFYLFDFKAKRVHADIDTAVFGSMQMEFFSYLVTMFVNPDPFEYERRAEKTETRRKVTVGNEECYELYLKFGGGFDTWYFFSTRDALPRRIEWAFVGPDGRKFGSRLTLSELDLDFHAKPDSFKLSVPEGFTKTDEFAP